MTFKTYLKHTGLSLCFYTVMGLIFYAYLASKNNLDFLSSSHLLRFDAVLYQDIKVMGYHVDWLCAFFPAFPFLWNLLNTSPAGISIVNAAIFILSSGAIAALYDMNWKKQMFFLSIPSVIFMFTPYTEALFYAVGTLVLIGLKKNNSPLLLLGLVLEGLVRPTTFVFIPAILGAYFFAENNLKQSLKKSWLPVVALIVGLLITITLHYSFTGKWFVFFEAQKLWKNYLHLPQLPLTSWGGDGCVRYDGSALAIAIFCVAYLVRCCIQKNKGSVIVQKDFLFSALYIAGTAFLIIAYRDGNLYSLNRFIYATPFIIAVLNYFWQNYEFKWRHVWQLLLFTELFWLLFNSYNHIHNLLLFSTVSLYFILMLLCKYPGKIISTLSIMTLIGINCIGVIKLFYRFLNNGWVG